MTDYLPLPITDSPHNTRYPSKFIPKNFPTPLLEALGTLKARGIRVNLCSSSSVLDNRISEFNIICDHDQIILPDDIPETCECVYVYKKSDRWMVSRIDPVYESFTPLIFVKKNRSNFDSMYNIDNGEAVEFELISYNLEKGIFAKIEKLDLICNWIYKSKYMMNKVKRYCHRLALAINSLSYSRISESYYDLMNCIDKSGIVQCRISEGAPEFNNWLESEIVRISALKNRPVKHDDPEAERRNNYLERLSKSL